MSAILELMVFFSYCLMSVFNILDSVYLSGHSMLDIICSMGYISITFWGIFELIGVNNNNNEGD